MEDAKKLIIAKAEDTLRICRQRNTPKFFGFLSPGEAAVVKEALGNNSEACFFGGYFEAERTVFGALPEFLEGSVNVFPITPILISYNKNYFLTHRDVLGALMSAGVNRSTVGDIVIGEGKAVVFALSDVTDYFVAQITKIKNVGVKAEPIYDISQLDFLNNPKKEELSFTVSSLRLDAVVSSLAGVSRTKSVELIEGGLVFVNSFEVTKTTKKVLLGDIISVRRYGKFKITETGDVSKKGREIVSAEKYI